MDGACTLVVFKPRIVSLPPPHRQGLLSQTEQVGMTAFDRSKWEGIVLPLSLGEESSLVNQDLPHGEAKTIFY